jgi:hypothetical protein
MTGGRRGARIGIGDCVGSGVRTLQFESRGCPRERAAFGSACLRSILATRTGAGAGAACDADGETRACGTEDRLHPARGSSGSVNKTERLGNVPQNRNVHSVIRLARIDEGIR